jgi:hypothetical protein
LSKVSITGNASGSGTFTLAAPDSNSDRTLTLPDNTGTIVTSASSIAASQLPAGSVIQVVSATSTTQTIVSAASYTVTAVSASITPSSTSNKILIVVSTFVQNNTGDVGNFATLYRNGSVNLGGGSDSSFCISYSNDGFDISPAQMVYLDSPSSTSSVTYAVYAKATSGQIRIGNAAATSTITLMEIAA